MPSKELIWIAEARKYIGEEEISGPVTNPRLKHLFDLVDGLLDKKYLAGMDEDDIPWCAAFVSGILESVGIESARSWWARSYRQWGRSLFGPVYGAVVVFERGPTSGHVGFVVGKTDRSAYSPLWVLGGNQSDAVNVKLFPRSRVLAYRYPDDVSLPNFLLPVFGQAEEFSEKEI